MKPWNRKTGAVMLGFLYAFLAVLTPPVFAASDSQLISLNKTVLTSSVGGSSVGSRVTDGNQGTYWESSYTDTASLQHCTIDLENLYQIDTIEFFAIGGAGNAPSRMNFKILASDDPGFASYTELVPEVTEEVAAGTLATYTITDTESYRFVRLARTTVGYFVVAELSVYGQLRYENASVGKSVTALTTGSWSSTANITDEVYEATGMNTPWESMYNQTEPQYFTIDLGEFYKVHKIAFLAPPGNAGSRKNLRFLGSADPGFSEYTELVPEITEEIPESSVRVFTVSSADGYRYIRAEQTQTVGSFVVSGVSVYGEITDAPPQNISAGKPVTVSSYSGTTNGAQNIVDGNTGSYWESDFTQTSALHWFQIDLEEACYISRMRMYGRGYNPNSERANFEVLASNDPSFASYTVLGQQGAEPFPANSWWQADSADQGNAYRYVRVRQTATGYFLVLEFSVYGTKQKLSAQHEGYISGGAPCTALTPGAEISFTTSVKNNSGAATDVSCLLVLFKDGRVLDAAIDRQQAASGAACAPAPRLTLPADVSGCTLGAYLFDNFANMTLIDSDIPALEEADTTETATAEGDATSLGFDYTTSRMQVNIIGGADTDAGKGFLALVTKPDASGQAQTLSDTDDSAAITDKLLAVAGGITNADAKAVFTVPMLETDLGGVYTAAVSFATPDAPQMPTVAEKTYMDSAAQKVIVGQIQDEPVTTLGDMLSAYSKGSLNPIFPDIDLSDAFYLAHAEEVLQSFDSLRTAHEMTEVRDVHQTFAQAMLLTEMKYSDITEAMADDMIPAFGLEDTYYTPERRAEVASRMNAAYDADPFETVDEVQKAFDEAVFLTAAGDVNNTEMTQLVTAYSHILGLSYDTLDSTQVNKALTGTDYADIAAFQSAFNNRKTALTQSTTTTTGGRGSGSGGRSSDRSVLFDVPPMTAAEDSEAPKEASAVFTDIDTVPWAEEAIYYLSQRGIDGKAEGIFAPNDPLKREEGAKMLLAALEVTAAEGTETFLDAQAGAWYVPYLSTVSRMGYFMGDEAGNFGIGRALTRQDFAAVLFRVLENSAISVPEADGALFTDDGEIASYARMAVHRLAAAGIINGMGDGSFGAKETVTRAQAAKMLHGLVNYMSEGGAAA